MDGLVFLTQLSSSTGVYSGSRYVSASPSQDALFLKFIHRTIYFGFAYNGVFILAIQNTSNNLIAMYQFSSGINIYDFIFSSTNTKYVVLLTILTLYRMILVGSSSIDVNAYIAEAPFQILDANPNI